MSCPVNFSTVKKGIENKAAQMLTQSGQFERVDQTSVRVKDITSDYNNLISNVNNAFREEIIKKHGEFEYKIQPSDNLINTYLEAAPIQEQSATAPTKEGVSELFESNPELANAVYESLGIPKIKLYRVYNTDANGIVIEGQEKYKGQWFTSDLDYALSYIEKNKKVIKGKNVTDNKYDYSGLKVDIIELNPSEAKKYLLSKETIYNEKLDVEPDNFIIPKDVNRSQTINLGEKIGISDKVVKSFLQIDKDKYKQFIPLPSSSTFNNINQQKQQAQQLYQSFLDVYLQDFEQVESILKEEKIIDKKCS